MSLSYQIQTIDRPPAPPAAADAALAWARRRVAFERADLVHHLPWAQTLRLVGVDGVAYLKILPPTQARVVGLMPALAKRAPDLVPAVIAADRERGLLLLAEHGGMPFPTTPRSELVDRLVDRYAQLQARAVGDEALLALLPRPELGGLVGRLLDFLAAEERTEDGTVAAARFLGLQRASLFHRPLAMARSRLEALIALAAPLPPTLEHGDLNGGNLALRPDGTIALIDWDDAVAGPAGLSLPGILGACAPTIEHLLTPEAAARVGVRPELAHTLERYIWALAESGYAAPDQLRRALPGSLLAGVILHLLTFAALPPREDETKLASAAAIEAHLRDLLDLVGWLALDDPSLLAGLLAEYAEHGALARACPLVHRALREDGRRAARLSADIAALGASPRTRRGIELATELSQLFHEAEQPTAVPRIRLEEADRRDPEHLIAKLELGFQLFQRHGALMIEGAYPPALLETCHRHFLEQQHRYLVDRDHEDALRVGDKRFMVTVPVEGCFANPAIYAAPLVMPLLERLLGPDLLVGSFNVVASLPGAADQWVHKDHPALFPELGQMPLPSFAINTIIPLIPLDEQVGTTCLIKGSHRVPGDEVARMPRQRPMVPLGGCLLIDYRLTHLGLANRSERVRPILSINYHRSWFRDIANHAKQRPVEISAETLLRVPLARQRLFAWARLDP